MSHSIASAKSFIDQMFPLSNESPAPASPARWRNLHSNQAGEAAIGYFARRQSAAIAQRQFCRLLQEGSTESVRIVIGQPDAFRLAAISTPSMLMLVTSPRSST
jgi:hypothetical protein